MFVLIAVLTSTAYVWQRKQWVRSTTHQLLNRVRNPVRCFPVQNLCCIITYVQNLFKSVTTLPSGFMPHGKTHSGTNQADDEGRRVKRILSRAGCQRRH